MKGQRLRILHVEVGGRYGGSLKALELYLAHSDHSCFEHEVLFYYLVPHEGLKPWVKQIHVLRDGPLPESSGNVSATKIALRAVLGETGLSKLVSEIRKLVRIVLGLPTVWRLSCLLRTGSYDLVHINNTFDYQPLTLLAAWMARIPVIAHVRNPVSPCAMSRTLMRLTRCIVSVNRSFDRELRGWGVPIPIHTCRDGVLLRPPNPYVCLQLRRALLLPPQESILIGSAGRLDEQKGYDVLIRAARIVVDEQPDVQFAIAGEGPLSSALTELISSLGLDKNLRLCGFHADVENFLFALDIFVSSSNWEGLPLALMEAMLLGKPVVATDVGGNSEVVEPGVTGKLVPAGDPVQLANALLAAIEEYRRGVSTGHTASQSLATLTDPQRTANMFDHIIREQLISAAGAAAEIAH